MSPVSGGWRSMSLPHLVTFENTHAHTGSHTHTDKHNLPPFKKTQLHSTLRQHCTQIARSPIGICNCLCVVQTNTALKSMQQSRGVLAALFLIYQSSPRSSLKMNFSSSLPFRSELLMNPVIPVIVWSSEQIYSPQKRFSSKLVWQNKPKEDLTFRFEFYIKLTRKCFYSCC